MSLRNLRHLKPQEQLLCGFDLNLTNSLETIASPCTATTMYIFEETIFFQRIRHTP